MLKIFRAARASIVKDKFCVGAILMKMAVFLKENVSRVGLFKLKIFRAARAHLFRIS